jgi:peptide/nickel transport system permease protein
MGAYIVRRMLLLPITLMLLITIFFFMLRTIPGDLVDFIYQEGGTTSLTTGVVSAGDDAPVEDVYAAQLRAKVGLDKPAHIQFYNWFSRIIRGDFGFSFINQKPAWDVIDDKMPASIQLGVLGLLLALAMGIPMGIIAARFADTWIDNSIRVFSLTGLSTPAFVTAALIMVILSMAIGWVPPEYVPFTENPAQNLTNMVFPVAVVAFGASAPLTRLIRSQMLEVMNQDFIRTARAKGLSERAVFYKHGLRNALLPIVTVVGFSLDNLVAGSVITEQVFGINGMGKALVDASSQRDFPVLQLFVFIIGGIVLGINLLVDLSYAFIDPRIRYS